MSLYAFHLGQIISTVLGQVDKNGQRGNSQRPKLATPKYDDFAIVLSTVPNHKSFGLYLSVFGQICYLNPLFIADIG